MQNMTKIIIGIVAAIIIVLALFAFDVPYGSDEDSVEYLINVTAPAPDSTIESPAAFTGEARGQWFFEATFPVDVVASDGKVIGRGYAEALGEWMTEEFVPWRASVSFDATGYDFGKVRFMRNNPSGLPQNDAFVEIPVKFESTDGAGGAAGGIELTACRATGCSRQICGEEDVASTCEFKPEYACYKTAKCERQSDGLCGWTETPILLACLKDPPQP